MFGRGSVQDTPTNGHVPVQSTAAASSQALNGGTNEGDKVEFVDTAGRHIKFLLSRKGTVSFFVDQRQKVLDIKMFHAENTTMFLDGKRLMTSPPSVTVRSGQEDLIPNIMELFGQRFKDPTCPPLNVTIRSARGLRNADGFFGRGSSDPYCVCEIAGKPTSTFKTKTINNTQEPLWNHLAEIADYSPGDTVVFKIWDKDWGKKDDFLGLASYQLDSSHLQSFEGDLHLDGAGDRVKAFISVKITSGTQEQRDLQRARELAAAALKRVRELAAVALKSRTVDDLNAAINFAKESNVPPSEYGECERLLFSLQNVHKLLNNAYETCLVDDLKAAIDAAELACLPAGEYSRAVELVQQENRRLEQMRLNEARRLQEIKMNARRRVEEACANPTTAGLTEALEAAEKAGLEKSEYQKAVDALERLRVMQQLLEEVRSARAAVMSNGTVSDRVGIGRLVEVRDSLTAALRCARRAGNSEQELLEGELIRKRIHNRIEDLKGTIRVFARIRPLTQKEIGEGDSEVTSQIGLTGIEVQQERQHIGQFQHEFQFDAVFMPGTQDSVFADCKELVQSAVDGYNVTIFAYGQTGAGKTHTMVGTTDESGIAPRTIREIYDVMNRDKGRFEFTVTGSVLELYCNKLVDLMASKQEAVSVTIRHDDATNKFYMEDLSSKECHSATELEQLFAQGLKHRTVAQTCMNTDSSRSHLVFSITIQSSNKVTNEELVGKIVLCDLAGSERLKKSKATGDREKEAIDINKSLSSLGDVIEALATKSKFIPYRNHKLTQILQDSLGGTAKTLMFVNCSPAQSNCEETINSLRFGKRAKGVVNVPGAARRVPSNSPSPAPRSNAPSPSPSPRPRNGPSPPRLHGSMPASLSPRQSPQQMSPRRSADAQATPKQEHGGAAQPLPMRVAAIERTVLGTQQTGGLLPRIAALEETLLGGVCSSGDANIEGRLEALQKATGVFCPPTRTRLEA